MRIELECAVQSIALVKEAHHAQLVDVSGVFEKELRAGRFAEDPLRRRSVFPALVAHPKCRERPEPHRARKVVARLHAKTESVALHGVAAEGVEIGSDFDGTLDDISRAGEHGKAFHELVLGHALDGVHHPIRVGRTWSQWRGADVLPFFFQHLVGPFGKAHVPGARPRGIWPALGHLESGVHNGLVAVNAHAPFAQADVGEVFFPGQNPPPIVLRVRLTPRIVAHKVDVGPFTDFGLYMLQPQRDRVDPHFPLEGQFPPSSRHKSEVKARVCVEHRCVQNVVAVVDVAPVVQWTCERLVQQEHLILVEVDVQKLGLHARGVFAVLHPRGPGGFNAFFAAAPLGSLRPGHLGDEEGQGDSVLGGVKLVPDPGKGSPKSTLREFFGVVVQGHLLDFIEPVVQGRNAGGIVAFLGFGHPLHQGFGGVNRLFVWPNDGRLKVHAARLQGDVDDLRHPALERDGLALVPQGGIGGPRHPDVSCVQGVGPVHIGHGSNGRAVEADVHKRQRLACGSVKDTARDGRLGVTQPGHAGQHQDGETTHQLARRLSCRRAIQMPNSYSTNTGNETRIWLVTSGGVMTAERAKIPTSACRR